MPVPAVYNIDFARGNGSPWSLKNTTHVLASRPVSASVSSSRPTAASATVIAP